MRIPMCNSPFTETKSSALDVRSSRRMPCEDTFAFQALNPDSTFTVYRTTTFWNRRRNRSSLTNRWSTHPISQSSSSPSPRLFRLRQSLRWSTIRRLIQLQACRQRNGCTSLDCTINSANGWTITRATTRSAHVFVRCDRQRLHPGRRNLRHQTWRERGRQLERRISVCSPSSGLQRTGLRR
jgi:hypothetical protein